MSRGHGQGGLVRTDVKGNGCRLSLPALKPGLLAAQAKLIVDTKSLKIRFATTASQEDKEGSLGELIGNLHDGLWFPSST